MDTFKKELSPAREYVFGEALKDIWIQGAAAAEGEQREYTADEYYRVLDGLSYEDVVKYTDPTGDTAKTRYRNAAQSAHRTERPSAPDPGQRDASAAYWTYPGGFQPRGSPSLQGIPGQQ